MSHFLSSCISLVTLCCTLYSPPHTFVQSKTLVDLRRFRIQTLNGRFLVNREALEDVILGRRKQDYWCGEEVNGNLNVSLPKIFDLSTYGEVLVLFYTIEDLTLQEDLLRDLQDEVETSFQGVGITIPILSNGKKGLLHIIDFVKSNKQVILPHTTSSDAVVKIDTIEDGNDGTVTLRKGSDVMIMKNECDETCKNDLSISKDFKKITGKSPMITDYPRNFDWKCDILGWNTSFCQVLKKYQCRLDRAGGDVCNDMPNISSRQCLASMQILNMTGIFREMAPFLAETTPNESFESEWVMKEHSVDITFPCLII